MVYYRLFLSTNLLWFILFPSTLPLEFLLAYFFLYFWFVKDRISLCSPDCPGLLYIGQAGLELIEIHLLLPPKRWN